MREVTKHEFFAFISALGELSDPMPTTERPDVTLWRNQRGPRQGQVIAKSYPGWKTGGPERYEIEQ